LDGQLNAETEDEEDDLGGNGGKKLEFGTFNFDVAQKL